MPKGFPCRSDGKESACNEGAPSSIPGLGKTPGEENGDPFQYSHLENAMDRGVWWAAIYGVAQSRTQLKRLSSSIYMYTYIHLKASLFRR